MGIVLLTRRGIGLFRTRGVGTGVLTPSLWQALCSDGCVSSSCDDRQWFEKESWSRGWRALGDLEFECERRRLRAGRCVLSVFVDGLGIVRKNILMRSGDGTGSNGMMSRVRYLPF